MQSIKEFIKNRISEATAENPVTSTRLIEEVREQFGKSVSARWIRSVVEVLQHEGCPVAGLKTEPKGYFWIHNLNDYKRYEREINNYWQTVRQTRDLVKANFLGLPKKSELDLFEL